MSGAAIIVKALQEQGVEVIFGYPGGAVLPLYDELFKTKIFQGWRLPPDAALDDFSSKTFKSSSETGLSKNDLIEDLDWTASVTFIFLILYEGWHDS